MPPWTSRDSTSGSLSAGTASNRTLSIRALRLILPLLCLTLCASSRADEFDDPIQTAMEERDYSKAFHLTKVDAERGIPKAMGNLGLLYEKGLGTPVDLKLAAQ